jgi:predicted permease
MNPLRWLFRRGRIEGDLDTEIKSHFEMAIAERIAAGEDPQSARLAALNEFGNPLQMKEDARDVWRGGFVALIADTWQDVRFGTRMLFKNPGFSLVVIAVLTLGIAGNAAVFSLFNGLALKPLPGVQDSSKLAVMVGRSTAGRTVGLSLPDYRYIRDHNRTFSDLTSSLFVFASIGRGADAERTLAEMVTGNYFQVLGAGAQLGRTLLPSDDLAPGQHPVAVISDGLWRRSYGAAPDAVGQTLYLNGQPLTIVGVAEPAFHGTVVSMVVDVFAPIMMQPQVFPPNRLEQRTSGMLMALGRLRPGVAMADAAAESRVLAAQLDADKPIANFTTRADVVPIWQSPFGAQTYMLPAIAMLGGMGVLILLVVCANIANLVLVRGISRQGELAVRVALGASRGRLLRLLFIENMMMAIPGALAGVALGAVVVPLTMAGASSSAPGAIALDTSVDAYVMAFALILSAACAVVFGFAPALRTSRVDIVTLMNDVSPRMAGRGRLRGLLVVSQVAVSLVLLVGAGLVLRSYTVAQHADGGFDSRNVTSVAFDLQPGGYDDSAGLVFATRLLDAVEAEPVFESVTLAKYVPMGLVDTDPRTVEIEGYAPKPDEDMGFLNNVVGPGYFRTLRIPLLAGREFTRRDDGEAVPVVIVNETLARRMWQTPENAVGKRLRTMSSEWLQVVGVARDVTYSRLSEEPRPYFYFAVLQTPTPSLHVHARSRADAPDALARIEQILRTIDPQVPIGRSVTLAEQTRVALVIYAMAAGALTIFGVMTMVLAALGVYGLVAYTVQQSTQEIGIRLAVGARRIDVAWTFLKRGALLAAGGAAVGLVLAVALSSSIRTLLYGVSTRDLTSFGGGTMVVIFIALSASLIPAWRASKTDPLSALRHH